MKIALFGGSFDPIHNEHIGYIKAAKEALSLDKIVLIPSYVAPHKLAGAVASGKDRLNMCRLALQDLGYAEVSDFELARGERSYTYITAEHFRERYKNDSLFLLVGADMLEDFFTWKNPERILSCVTLCACSRGEQGVSSLHQKFEERFGVDYQEIPFAGANTSSTALRVRLAFGKRAEELPPRVEQYIKEKGLYTHPAVLPALALEKEERREHSFRVAIMATERAHSLNVSKEKALLASALHDAGKYVPLSSGLLEGFSLSEEVPPPVMHQFTGAYLAEHAFGVKDEEVLDAIRYHTSGRANMTTLGKLIFLADMLEEGRTFEGVEELRKLFYSDLDACLLAALERQVAYLRKEGKPVYPKTQEALDYLKKAD